MKARVSNNNTEKNNEIVLSIGMIVKNEEKHLENCLSALKNLTDHISSELIIVDTGSTDRTKEIALRYTDKVYDFEWVDDFAAARNYGLKKAKGKWFMFLDADEYFDENCSQMIKFFSYPELYEHGEWNCGTVSMQNYDKNNEKKSSLFFPVRLAKINKHLKFSGKIHEYLNVEYPIASFETLVHHYGYISNNANMIYKRKRNMELLLREHKERPDDVRIIGLIIDSCIENTERQKYVELALKMYNNGQKSYVNKVNLIRAIKFYYITWQYRYVLNVAEKYCSDKSNKKGIGIIDIYFFQANSYKEINDFVNAISVYDKYFKAYNAYKQNKLLMDDASYITIDAIDEQSYNYAKFNYI